MFNFQVSARKYRPRKFNEVVGQQQVTVTLRNALKNEKLAHAFLFTGPRGVGKTSCARILAKTINCANNTDENEACGTCINCTSFDESSAMNVFELDAASNNSVENMRELIEQVRFAPQMGKYKVYIIDEVHMLSTSAFNAFLKTLEEPPSYAIFILATTEKHKILPTILSRCQIFDFTRITIQQIADHLAYVCEQEKHEYQKDALHIIAQKSDGGLRDALSMLDRLVSFTGGKLTTAGVMENLNLLDYETFFNATKHLLNDNISELLLSLDTTIRAGFEPEDYLLGLLEHYRNLLVAQHEGMQRLIQYTENLKTQYIEQAQLINTAQIINSMAVMSDAEVQYKTSKNKRMLLEMALIRVLHINKLVKNNVAITGSDDEKKK
jgi:DNA polymerase-3 subunit gamma/tau